MSRKQWQLADAELEEMQRRARELYAEEIARLRRDEWRREHEDGLSGYLASLRNHESRLHRCNRTT